MITVKRLLGPLAECLIDRGSEPAQKPTRHRKHTEKGVTDGTAALGCRGHRAVTV